MAMCMFATRPSLVRKQRYVPLGISFEDVLPLMGSLRSEAFWQSAKPGCVPALINAIIAVFCGVRKRLGSFTCQQTSASVEPTSTVVPLSRSKQLLAAIVVDPVD